MPFNFSTEAISAASVRRPPSSIRRCSRSPDAKLPSVRSICRRGSYRQLTMSPSSYNPLLTIPRSGGRRRGTCARHRASGVFLPLWHARGEALFPVPSIPSPPCLPAPLPPCFDRRHRWPRPWPTLWLSLLVLPLQFESEQAQACAQDEINAVLVAGQGSHALCRGSPAA